MAKPAIRLTGRDGDLAAAIAGIERPIARAATGAMLDLADVLKREARQNIASAGFGTKWQKALRVDTYPRGRLSMRPAALIYHKIGYADIFETGGRISGKPLLWLPFTAIGVPPRLGRDKLTPKLFNEKIGPLDIVRKGRRPLLVAPMELTRSEAKAGKARKVTLAKLRRGAAGRGRASTRALAKLGQKKSTTGIIRSVPVFVGVDRVTMPDRLRIREITKTNADRLPLLYARNLNVSD